MARLGTTRIILQDAEATPAHQNMSSLQRAALLEVLSRKTLDATARASIADLVVKIRWYGSDCTHVLNGLSGSAKPTVGQNRRRQQVWSAVCHYFTEEDWATFDSDRSTDFKLATLLDVCASLGLRCPSEPTMKFLTSLWMVIAEPPESLQHMNHVQKNLMYQHLKSTFHNLRNKFPDPVVYLDKLPDSPTQFMKDHPHAFKQHFGDRVPVPCPIDVQSVSNLDLTYSCRGGKPHCSSFNATQQKQSQPFTIQSMQSGGDTAMAQIANVFMQRMEAMQTSQQRMLEMCVRGPDSGSLAGLADKSFGRHSLQRMPTIQLCNGNESGPAQSQALSPQSALCGTSASGVLAIGAGQSWHAGAEEQLTPRSHTSQQEHAGVGEQLTHRSISSPQGLDDVGEQLTPRLNTSPHGPSPSCQTPDRRSPCIGDADSSAQTPQLKSVAVGEMLDMLDARENEKKEAKKARELEAKRIAVAAKAQAATKAASEEVKVGAVAPKAKAAAAKAAAAKVVAVKAVVAKAAATKAPLEHMLVRHCLCLCDGHARHCKLFHS